MASDAVVGSPTDIIAAGLDRTSTALIVACPCADTIRALVDATRRATLPEQVRVLTTVTALETATDDFFTATQLADHVHGGQFLLRTLDDSLDTRLLVSGERALVLVATDGQSVGVSTDDAEAVDLLSGRLTARWEEADVSEVGEPDYSSLLTSIQQEFGETFSDAFATVTTTPQRTRGPERNLDVVDVLLLLAAVNREQFYRVSRWGDEAGIASVTKFSQSKRRLEEAGLIETESVATEGVGRPRQRLVLPNSLADASTEEVVNAAQSVLV